MEQFAMTEDGAALLLGFIAGVVVLAIIGVELEIAWERWKRRKANGV